jgi:hypothetical protein
VTLTWAKVPNVSYELVWIDGKFTTQTDSTSLSLPRLALGKRHQFTVLAKNACGRGAQSDVLEVDLTTKPARIEPAILTS